MWRCVHQSYSNKSEAASYSETSINVNQPTCHHTPEDRNIKYCQKYRPGPKLNPSRIAPKKMPTICFQSSTSANASYVRHFLSDRWYPFETRVQCEISGFRRGVVEIFALLGCYAVLVGCWQQTKKSNWTVYTLKNGTDITSRNVGNYKQTLCNIPEERRPQEVHYILNWLFVLKKTEF